MTVSRCDGCGAEIYWITTTAGKPMPVDTQKRTILAPESWTQGLKGVTSDSKWITVSGYQSHFASCPKANQFRKPKSD